MQLVDAGVLRQSQHQALSRWNFKLADVFHG
jgi:hypothetical protein